MLRADNETTVCDCARVCVHKCVRVQLSLSVSKTVSSSFYHKRVPIVEIMQFSRFIITLDWIFLTVFPDSEEDEKNGGWFILQLCTVKTRTCVTNNAFLKHSCLMLVGTLCLRSVQSRGQTFLFFSLLPFRHTAQIFLRCRKRQTGEVSGLMWKYSMSSWSFVDLHNNISGNWTALTVNVWLLPFYEVLKQMSSMSGVEICLLSIFWLCGCVLGWKL